MIMLGGCSKVGPEFLGLEGPKIDQWQDADNAVIQSEQKADPAWWRAFDDQVLNDLIEQAYAQNYSLKVAGARVLEARANLGVAVGGLYPQSQTLNANITRFDISSNVAETGAARTPVADLDFWNFQVGLGAAWELDFWGKVGRAIESADANVLARVANYDNVLVRLLIEVARTYVVVRTFEERLEIARQNVEIQRRSLEIADVRFRNNLTTELDVQQARAFLRNTEASIPRLEAGLRQAKNALSILLGEPPGSVEAILTGSGGIPSAPTQVAVGVPADLLRRRPDVRQAELQAATQSALIGVAQAELYPRIALIGSIGLVTSEGTDSALNTNAGVDDLFTADSLQFIGGPSVSWNIFNYGRIKNNVRVQDARLQALLENYQDTVLRAAREFEDSAVSFLKTKEEVSFLDDSVDAAARSVDLALVQYRDGTSTYTRVLDTQSRLLFQQELLTTTRGRVARSLIDMYQALGGGWEIRAGNDFVSDRMKAEMQQRTDWGDLLKVGSVETEPDKVQDQPRLRSPDW